MSLGVGVGSSLSVCDGDGTSVGGRLGLGGRCSFGLGGAGGLAWGPCESNGYSSRQRAAEG